MSTTPTRLNQALTRTSRIDRWRRLAAGALALAAASVVAVSCGSSKNGPGGGSCAIGGDACPHGCLAGVGCVQCGANADCSPNAPFCVLGACVSCQASTDCAAGQVCEPADNTCRPKCTTAANCTPDAPICDAATGTCVGCQKPTDCPASAPICWATTAQCSQCAANTDCSATDPVCDLGSGHCVQCLIDGDCQAGYLCMDHHCETGCKSNADCGGDHPLCDIATGICGACHANADCGGLGPFCAASGACVECLVSSDCKTPGMLACSSDGRCVQCISDANCAAPLPACNNNVCAQCSGGGANSMYCPAGQKCHGGTCS
jgi:hypothetical protein